MTHIDPKHIPQQAFDWYDEYAHGDMDRRTFMSRLASLSGLVTGFDDVAVVGQPIQQGGGHLGVAEHARPFGEAQVGGDHHAGVFVQLG